jgi:3-isopropylmalate dehydrogenase
MRVLGVLKKEGLNMAFTEAPLGGQAYDRYGHPYPEFTQNICRAADAVLLGAVGGPQYDNLDRPLRPERGLLGIRKDLGLFANLRPAVLYPELANASTLKPEVVSGLDIMIVRELTGDVYFGQPRGMRVNEQGEREGFNTMVYAESEVRRIAHVAFGIAMKRKKKLCSVDKANVLETTEFWKEIVIDVAKEYPEVELSHMYVDNAAMQLIRNPKQFDVMVTGNIFGDILSDEASMLTGSIGMLASASLNETKKGLYEPSHGFDNEAAANRIENAVKKVLAAGYRTGDIFEAGTKKVSCSEMGDQIVAAM